MNSLVHRKFTRHIFLLSIAAIVVSCISNNKKQTADTTVEQESFTLLSADVTGLNFNNKLEETTYMNGFYYEYFYNGGGVAVADFNNDGLDDIYFISNLRTNKLYLNKGNLKFKNVSIKAKAQGNGGFPTGVTIVDINNDGLKDIYILKSGRFDTEKPLRNELLINKGVDADQIPVFEENAKEYGLDLPHYSTQASFLDYDRDGDLDMFLINHNIEIYEIDDVDKVMKNKSDKIGEKLYRNDNGKYVNVTEESGIISNALGFTLGLAIGDVNNDGWPDVYTSNDYYEKDHLYLNNQNGTFSEKSLQAFGHISTFSMGNDMADINNDGLMDIVSLDMMAQDNYTQKTSMSGMNVADFYMIENQDLHRQYMYNALQLNNGNDSNSDTPLFSDIAQMAGVSSTDWSWAPLLFDMDNDGYRDLFVSNGIKRDFRNNDFLIYLEQKYQEGVQKSQVNLTDHVEDLLGKLPHRKKENYFFLNGKKLLFDQLAIQQPASYSSGAAYADFDKDGDLDLVVNNTDDFAYLYRNNSEQSSYIDIRLKGQGNNLDAIGTRVELVIGEEHLVAEQYFTRGFQSAMATSLHFGLANATKIDSIKVLWPDGKSQFLFDEGVNREIVVSYDPSLEDAIIKSNQDYKFVDITAMSHVEFEHIENIYNDFHREGLLPHKMSEEGPALAVGDVNGDGMDDFYIGGAKGYPGVLYYQSATGSFEASRDNVFLAHKDYEDVDAILFDVDKDQDLDLYIVSGGNENDLGSHYYSDRLYLNEEGKFTITEGVLPAHLSYSGSVARPYDYDQDGDIDIFIGGYQSPGAYPYPGYSFLLKNESEEGNVYFEEEKVLDFGGMGMVTDATWIDIDADGWKDLVVVGEWMPVKVYRNLKGQFSDITEQSGLGQQTGWWYSIGSADFDHDGDVDIVVGNLGLNAKYQTSKEEPFQVYAKDFDQSGSLDIVLGFHEEGKLFPLRGRECSSNQMPFIKKKFPNYHAYASAGLEEVYGEENIETALHYEARTFATTYFENNGEGVFRPKHLPALAQLTTTNEIIPYDVNKDGHLDMVLFGNLYGFEVETPRQDAGYGLYLAGDGKGNFVPKMPHQSGLYVTGSVSNASLINIPGNKQAIIIAKNDDSVQVIRVD